MIEAWAHRSPDPSFAGIARHEPIALFHVNHRRRDLSPKTKRSGVDRSSRHDNARLSSSETPVGCPGTYPQRPAGTNDGPHPSRRVQPTTAMRAWPALDTYLETVVWSRPARSGRRLASKCANRRRHDPGRVRPRGAPTLSLAGATPTGPKLSLFHVKHPGRQSVSAATEAVAAHFGCDAGASL